MDKNVNTVDFLLTKKRQQISALKFLLKAIQKNKKPNLNMTQKNVSLT